MKAGFKLLLVLFIILVLVNIVLLFFYFNPQTLPKFLVKKLSKTPEPGSCLILEERYCKRGKLINHPSEPNILLAVFKVPKGTVLFAPVTGFYSNTPTFFFIKNKNPKEVVTYPGATITVSDDNTVATAKATYGFIYFKERENYYSRVKKGEVIGWVSEKPIEFLGDYNLVVDITKYKWIKGKLVFESDLEELKKMLKIK